jgi:hypothetical protein
MVFAKVAQRQTKNNSATPAEDSDRGCSSISWYSISYFDLQKVPQVRSGVFAFSE